MYCNVDANMSSLDDSKSSDDSFIILGTSPGSSLDLKCEPVNGQPLNMKQMEDSIQDFSTEANMALKAHFKLGDSPSPASLMVASNMITEDMSLEDLQNRFGELLDENLILKETLKKNNDSMKEQFLMIASCQEDMVKTIKMQEDKFVEAKALVERLRQTNKRLKKEAEEFSRSAGSNGSKSGPSSAVEFVTSPDDDTINKLTSQLELVEKQRRQLIVENEKLTWQKESLEHIVDLTTKERDRLLKALHEAEIKISINEETHNNEISELKETAKTLRNQLITMPTEEVMVRETKIKNLEAEVNALQAANKESKLQILDLYNVKLEHTKFKSTSHEQCKIYKIQLEKLTSKLKEAQKVELKPVSLPKSLEPTSEGTIVEYNVRLYEKALKHLSEHLTNVNQGSLNSLRKIIDLMSTLYDYKLERIKEEGFKEVLLDAMAQFEKQQNHDVVHIENVKSALAVFEKIFTDYKKSLTASPQLPSQSTDLNALTIALLARGEEVDNLKMELRELQSKQDDMALLRAQIDTYKMDFEAERESREKMACEKATLEGRLRTSLQEVERLSSVLEMAIKKYPDIIQTMARSTFPTGSTRSTTREQSSNARDTMFKCPQCTYFKAKTQEEIFKHLDNCLGPSFCNPM
ncbi:NF-kappa-B essential modulator isoform X2 [Amyelois transitella]|uniref:NF-kappa-B essential modulator isoform X2 n=1 Tax=Amyelois transitella TaxID=680683 RepID=UPI00298F92A4|nr:NF-kappa-B essential modulator isoform X2 [Amyelois transitella]